jgi:hypothetical protein
VEDSRPAASPEKNDAPPAISFTVGNLRHTVRPRQEAAGPNGQSSHPSSDIEGAQSAPIAAALRDGTPPAVTITLDVNVARDPAASTSSLDSQSPKE